MFGIINNSFHFEFEANESHFLHLARKKVNLVKTCILIKEKMFFWKRLSFIDGILIFKTNKLFFFTF